MVTSVILETEQDEERKTSCHHQQFLWELNL